MNKHCNTLFMCQCVNVCALLLTDTMACGSQQQKNLPTPSPAKDATANNQAYERRVCNPGTPLWERLVFGAFLLMVWGGLRWEMIQRCSPGSLVLDANVLRGRAWRSKTNKDGVPFGLWTFGLTARPPPGIGLGPLLA